MVIKGTLDASHALPTSGMIEGDTYIVGAKGTYNNIACKVGDFFVRTSNSWLRIPAGDEWEYNENTIKAIKVDNAGHADTANTAVSAGSATTDSNGNVIASTYLPLSGGTISVTTDEGICINRTNGTRGILSFKVDGSYKGGLGIGTDGVPFYRTYVGDIHTLIHSGNIGNQSVNYSTTSGACTGNAATATKLQTARTI